MKKKILCFSRSYLSKLLPTLDGLDGERDYYHIVLCSSEEKRVKDVGGTVVLNIESVVKQGLLDSNSASLKWSEPNDFREVTGFNWSPIYSDRYLPNLPESKRLAVAGIVFDSLDKLFKEYQFDYFISEPVALFITHAIFYFCEKNDVKSRFWVSTFFPDHFFFCEKLDYSSPAVRDHAAILSPEDEKSIKEFCEGVMNDKAGPVYHFSFTDEGKKSLTYFKQRTGGAALILSPTLLMTFLQGLRCMRAWFYNLSFPYKGDFQTAASFKEHLFYFKCLLTNRRYYDSLPENTESAVLYSLQYEPEASLLYAGPDFFDQISFVEMILRGLPSEKILYVKEHPNQFGALGLDQWKKLRKKYHSIRYIYGRESGRELIKKCSSVVTVSSSVGMDSVLLGKPVLLAGKAFYHDFPNVVKITGYSDIPELLKTAQVDITSKDKLLSLVTDKLAGIYANSYKGDPQPSAQLYSKDNLAYLIKAINSACS